ncbi:MAG: hypothetical protein LUD29_04300 [Clostridia bacterium]|nr:hypothetical protein [Clostridia bacterium]
MKKKGLTCGIIAATLALGIGLSGCSLISTNNQNNINLVIANVDIREAEAFEDTDVTDYADALSEESTEIYKRELLAYFLNAGYSYVQSGMSYSSVFTSLVDSLTQTEVLYQYASLYLLKYIDESKYVEGDVIEDYLAYSTTEYDSYMYEYSVESQKAMYVLDNVYSIITNPDNDDVSEEEKKETPNRVYLAIYGLYSSLNTTLDSFEEALFEDEDENTHYGSRTTPDNVDVEKENYYPCDENSGELDYGIYTGYGKYSFANSGTYRDDRVDGSTSQTRKSAYNSFVETLKANYLLSEDEEYSDILKLQYMQDEMTNQLKEQVIEQFYKVYELELEKEISDGDYLQNLYDEMLAVQESDYSTISGFGSALDSMSDESFVLYAPNTSKSGGGNYGFVYNILLPFDADQSIKLSDAEFERSNDVTDYNAYYTFRNTLLKDIKTTDQRDAWFNGSTDYSFDASKLGEEYFCNENVSGNSTRYLFFENNLTKTERYESLDKYTGLYAYNGEAYKLADDSYALFPNSLDIDDMLGEFTSYVDFVLGNSDKTTTYQTVYSDNDENGVNDFYEIDDFTNEDYNKNRKITSDDIDYTNFIYAYGKIDIGGDFDMYSLMDPESNYYKAMSAVNDLQYAYTTDTSVLSTYIGYSVSAGTTSYIKEFEKAAQLAIDGGEVETSNGAEIELDGGVGTFIVCSGDYGWHLIYVTAVYDNELGLESEDPLGYEVYTNIDWADIHTEGTFANIFFEYVLSIELDGKTDDLQTRIVPSLSDDDSIVLHEKNYKDLLKIG